MPPKNAPKPLFIPIFIPHAGCPHRCAFCDQTAITASAFPAIPDPAAINARVQSFLTTGLHAGPTTGPPNRHPIQIAFYGGNFLGLPFPILHCLLKAAQAWIDAGKVHGIRFSTRPDTIDSDRLNLISSYGVSCVEIGAQSMSDRVLAAARRGHDAATTARAVGLLKAAGYSVVLQMMLGLPGDDAAGAMASAEAMAALKPDGARIYPTVVLKGSVLARWHEKGEYAPMDLSRCVCLAARIHEMFRNRSIPVIRMGLQAGADLSPGAALVAGPYHPAFGHLVLSAIYLELAERALTATARPAGPGPVVFRVHPRRISALRGMKNENIQRLSALSGRPVRVVADPAAADFSVTLGE